MDDDTIAFPPKHKPFGPMSLLKRAEAALFRRDLIWLRDFDGKVTLTVKRKRKIKDEHGNEHVVDVACRYWPNFRRVILLDDGTIDQSDNENAEYIRHWVAYEEKEKLLMFMKNHEVYAVLPTDS